MKDGRRAPRVPARPTVRAQRPVARGRDLHGRAALVTGGGVRIGAAVARHLAAAGCDVAIHHNESARPAKDLARSLQARGVRAATVAADLTKDGDRKRLVAAAAKALGRPLDVLVNNASPFAVRSLDELSWDDLLDDLAVTAWAPFELTRSFAAQLPKGRTGHVVNFLDARIVDEDRRHVGYHLAKRMLTDLTRLCAIEYAPRVAVNAVAPGPTLPPPGMDARKGAALMERLRQRLPLQRTSTPDDLARAVVYLASSQAHTGQVLFVDGGRHLGRPE